MVEGNEPAALSLRLHRVLLGLAGRLDDTALSQARRLAARARTGEAAELIGGALIAGDIPVRPEEQRELATVLTASGAEEWFATQLRVGDVPPMEHRFSTTDAVAMGVAEALEVVVQRMPDVRGVYVVWRNTVAGTTPGPIPQRVVLAEVGPEGSAVATAYRMDSALRRAGIPAVVEVLEADAPWPEYHRQAVRAAIRVAGATGAGYDTYSGYEPSYRDDRRETAGDAMSSVPETVSHEYPSWPSVPEHGSESAATEASPHDSGSALWPSHGESLGGGSAAASAASRPSSRENVDVPAQYGESSWTAQPSETGAADTRNDGDLEPGELFWPQADASVSQSAASVTTVQAAEPAEDEDDGVPPETRAEQTSEMSAAEQEALRAALAETAEPSDERAENSAEQTTVTADSVNAPTRVTEPAVAFPPKDLDNPRLSERDRELLRELHEELAKREQQSAQVRLNGWDPGMPR